MGCFPLPLLCVISSSRIIIFATLINTCFIARIRFRCASLTSQYSSRANMSAPMPTIIILYHHQGRRCQGQGRLCSVRHLFLGNQQPYLSAMEMAAVAFQQQHLLVLYAAPLFATRDRLGCHRFQSDYEGQARRDGVQSLADGGLWGQDPRVEEACRR